jgi:hypothetical protein
MFCSTSDNVRFRRKLKPLSKCMNATTTLRKLLVFWKLD